MSLTELKTARGLKGQEVLDFSKLPGFDKDISTVKKSKDGKFICKFFNVPKGCQFGNSCKMEHVCDVKMPDGTACGSTTHIRTGHKQAVGPAGSSTDPDA